MKYIISKYARRYWLLIVIVCVLQTAQTMLNLYLPNMNAHIIDNGVVKGDIDYIYSEGSLMIAFAFMQFLATIFGALAGTKIAFSIARNVRDAIFKRIQEYSFRELALFGTPTLITRSTNDVTQVQQFITFFLTLIISSPIMLIGGTIMALEQDVAMSVVIAGTLPFIVLVMIVFIKVTMPTFRKFQKVTDSINGILREQITGLRVVKAFVRENSEQERFFKVNDKMMGLNIKVGRAMSLLFPIFMFITNVSMLVVMWVGGVRVDNGDMQIGSITAFITYMMYIMMSVLMSSMIFVMYPRAAISAKRIKKVLTTQTTVASPESPQVINDPKGNMEFHDVSFRYGGASDYVIHNVSFTALPGKTTAIIGSTGSGKSTLLRLLPRLADPTDGTITFDGVDIKDLDLDFLSENIAVIPQKAFLFSGTVAENMRFGKEDASDEDITQALKVAQSYDFLKAKADEEGIDNLLDLEVLQGGTNFSGGQRQRLSIARALVKKAKVYQFDDSFSALDYLTDHNLRQALKPWTKESTVIIVAQRISTIRHADQILVIDEGKIVGKGTHEELLESNTTYQEIVDSQLSAEEARK